MQPLDRIDSRESDSPRRAGTLRSAEIIRLDEWRQKHKRQPSRWWRNPPASTPAPPGPNEAPLVGRKVSIEACLIMLVVVSALAGAVFALMGLGYLP